MTDIEITEADYGDPIHAQGVVDVLNSYASDPVVSKNSNGPT